MDLVGDAAASAGLIGLAMGCVRLAEAVVTHLFNRFNKDSESGLTIVKLDHETSKLLKDTAESMRDVREIVTRKDEDGIPLVYTPRSSIVMMNDMALAMQDVQKDVCKIEQRTETIVHNIPIKK